LSRTCNICGRELADEWCQDCLMEACGHIDDELAPLSHSIEWSVADADTSDILDALVGQANTLLDIVKDIREDGAERMVKKDTVCFECKYRLEPQPIKKRQGAIGYCNEKEYHLWKEPTKCNRGFYPR